MADVEFERANKRKFQNFVEFDFPWGNYTDRLKESLENGESRFNFSVDDLRIFDYELATNFQARPIEFFPSFEESLRDIVSDMQKSNNTKNIEQQLDATQLKIGITGNMGKYHVTPRRLDSEYLGTLVCIEGIITRRSVVLPKVVRTVHYCPSTNKFHQRRYRDVTSLEGLPTAGIYPTKDENGNLLETEFGYCEYKDTQNMYIQEMPEKAPPGQLPRSVECVIEDDLVDSVKPGDRARIYGIYRAIVHRGSKVGTGVMKNVILVNNVVLIDHQLKNADMKPSDLEKIRKLSKLNNVADILANSVAPSIFGHHIIKKSLLLLLLSGVEKNLKNGTHIRGDINILMVGDPSTAKSQLLRFMMNIAPLSISTTGRASTGVGLTAAVVSDKDSKERTLQAGAMVLADRGVVCIDEFDKMNELDRVAMHEVMEQQTVTIAKAGVHTTLNARCSVVAAANPIQSQYNRSRSVQYNVGLPDSLLSRFDLVFILLDEKDSKKDRDISKHVLRIHQFRDGNESNLDTLALNNQSGKSLETDIQNSNPHFSALNADDSDMPSIDDNDKDTLAMNRHMGLIGSSENPMYSVSFLRKYIYYAKNRITPKLSNEVISLIADKYCELRRHNGQKTLPITPRALETLIRLSSAHARCRLSNEVTIFDVEEAYAVMEYAICFMNNTSDKNILNQLEKTDKKDPQSKGKSSTKKTKNDKSKKRKREELEVGSTSNEQNTEPDENSLDDISQKSNTSKKRKLYDVSRSLGMDDDDIDDDEDEDNNKNESLPSVDAKSKDYTEVEKKLIECVKRGDSIKRDELYTKVQESRNIERSKFEDIVSHIVSTQSDSLMESEREIFSM